MKKYFYQLKDILKKKFSKSKKEVKYKYFETLDDLPFYYWQKIYTEKNLNYLIIDVENPIFVDDLVENKLNQIWNNIYDEYIADFGFNKKMERVINIEREIALARIDKWLDDNKFLNNKIKILEKKLDRENQKTLDQKGNDYDRQTILIEKWLQSSIDTKKISTRKYFTYLQLISEESKKYALKNLENGKN